MDSHRCALPRVLTDSVDNRLPNSLLFAVLVVALPAAAHGEGSPETVPFCHRRHRGIRHCLSAYADAFWARDKIGSAAFPALANPAVAMKGMTAYGLGLNWYPSRGVALLVAYGHQVFTAADSAPARPNEDTLTARFQLIL
jgi:hypothetical protein